MDDAQTTVDFDDLSPAGAAAVVIEVDGFELVGEAVFLNQFVAS